MSGTDPSTPHPTESGAPGPQPVGQPDPAAPTRSTAPAVHVGGPQRPAPDDAPTSLMPALTAPAPVPAPPSYDPSDATRVAAPLRPEVTVGDIDATQFLPSASPPAPSGPAVGAVPTRTPSYATRRPLGTPPGGPYGGLFAAPLAPPEETAGQPDPQATQVASQAVVPPPPAPSPRPVPAPQPAADLRPAAVAQAAPAPQAAAAPPRPAGSARVLGRVEPPVAILGGVVGVLVVVAVVLGFTLFGGSGSPAGAQPSAGAQASAGAGPQPVVAERFAAPSRNIACTMTASEARCTIAQLSAKPAPVDGCDGTVGYVVKVGADGTVETPCIARKDQPHKASPKLETLAYGKSVTMGRLTCTSSETGVECRAKGTGKGFSIARAGVRML